MSVKVLDFGIAKLVADDRGEKGRTRTGSLLGTPLYMSPEQCRGAGTVDHRTDIYSLGCILFEMLAGRPPFIREGSGELIAAHLSEVPPDILSLEPSLHPQLGQLVMRMLAKDPDARPQTMLEVVQAVEGILGLPATQFLKAIRPPEGFPPPADPAPPTETAAVNPTNGSRRPELAIGGTQLLPHEPSAKVTTFSNTASELAGRATQPPHRRRMGWLVVVASVGVAVLGLFVFARTRTVSVNPGAEPPQGLAGSQPVQLPPPPPAEPPLPPPPREAPAHPVASPHQMDTPVAQKTDLPTSVRKHPPHKKKPAHSTGDNENPYTLIKEQ